MPVLIESSSENRRPRRPSITQQLQRMFHKDKPDDVSRIHFVMGMKIGVSGAKR